MNDEIEFELNDDGKSYIEVSKDMRLLMTSRNWQLQKKMIAKSDTDSQKIGDITWSSFRWYTSLQGALKDILHINLSKEFFNDAQSLIQAQAKVINNVKQAFLPKYEINEATS